MTLRAYFDETHSEEGGRTTAVAGFLFEPHRHSELRAQWDSDPIIRRMPWPHAARCHAARPPFGSLPAEDRKALMLRVNQIAAQTRGMGFVCELVDEEFKEWATQRHNARTIPNAYSMCVMRLLSMVRQHLTSLDDPRPVEYWFESGAAGQAGCVELLRRVCSSDFARDHYAVASYSFADKRSDPAFACADSLVWEWQRNQVEARRSDLQGVTDPGWRETFKAFYIDDSSPAIWPLFLGPRSFDATALTARWHGIRFGN